MKRKEIERYLNEAEGRYRAYKSTYKCEAKQDVLEYLEADYLFFKNLLEEKQSEKAKKILSKAKDKEPTEKYTRLSERDIELLNEFQRLMQPHIDECNKILAGKVFESVGAYVDQTEKIIQPSDNKTEAFDYELNAKFCIFNGWVKKEYPCTEEKCWFKFVDGISTYYSEANVEEFLNYLENPELIQETETNIYKIHNNFNPYGLFKKHGEDHIEYLSRCIDAHNNLKDINNEDPLKKSYNEGYEAGRKQPKSKEFWQEVHEDYDKQIAEAERNGFFAGWRMAFETTDTTSKQAFDTYLISKTSTEKNIHN